MAGGRIREELALPSAPALAARRHGRVPIHLDVPLDLFPEAGTELDYVTFADLVDRAARLLVSAGAGPGHRVMVVKRPNFDIPLLAFACARIGAVPVLVHPTVGAANLPVLVARARPAVLVTDAHAASLGVLDGLDAAGEGPARWYAGSAPVAGARPLLGLPPAELPGRPVPRPEDEQLVTHTSGTTGVPKLVLQTALTFAGQARPQTVVGRLLRVRDPYLVCISPVHVRTVAAIVSTLAVGLPLGFMTEPDPHNAALMLRRVRPGVVETVPNAFIRWEEIADEQPRLLASVRLFVSTFDAAHPRTIRTLLRAGRRGARYVQVYGQSETGPVAMKFYRREPGRRCADGRCVGRPLIGHSKVRIGGLEGGAGAVGRGTTGAIMTRTSAVTPTYLGTPDQRVDGWWAMGDVGVVTGRGCLHLFDRIVDRRPGTESLLALEDTILERVPELTEAVLVPMEDGRPPVPLICTRGDRPLPGRAWEAAVAGLPPVAPPVHLTWDEIPHTATWKVRRPEAALLLGSFAGGPPPNAAGAVRPHERKTSDDTPVPAHR
ncbi:class I adenylate-forming enzyme family protein [Streptomyces sp. NPDC052077]|uniref:class I adenylate-forming enzyme family protein n=1 Tax=Streptomyces sp. NPDC052077 TaxID=3154757 RepID=UPI003436E590